MNTQSSSSVSSSTATSMPSKVIPSKDSEYVTINEKVNLTIEQNEVLQMICKSYGMNISEYMQEALIEAMRFDIDEGNLSDVLLEKLGEENEKKKTGSNQSSTLTDELEKLKQQISG